VAVLERMWRKLAADTKDNPIFPLVHITGEEMGAVPGRAVPDGTRRTPTSGRG